MSPLHERNRANAQHSTGPRTAEGKAISSQNARRHGLSSAALFIPEGAEDEYHSLVQTLFAEVRPFGELQLQFFDQLLHASWNTGIARRLLAVALANQDEKKIASANRYVAQYERSFAKALAGIKALQTDLALRAIDENEPIAGVPITCEIKVIAHEATRLARLQERTQRPLHRFGILASIGNAFRLAPPETEAATGETNPVAEPLPDAA